MRLICVAVVLCIASGSLAQPEPGGNPGRQPGGPPDPETFVNRLLEQDANKDGRLARDEVQGSFADRLFEFDKNKDGFVDRAELTEFARQPRGRGPGAGQPQGEPADFHQAMERAGRPLRALRRASFSAETRTDNLASIQAIQSGLVAAKGKAAEVKMSPAAKEKFGTDEAAFRREMRRQIIGAIRETLTLESAIADDDAGAAAKSLAKLVDLQETAHDLFQEPEEEGGRPGPGGRPGAGR